MDRRYNCKQRLIFILFALALTLFAQLSYAIEDGSEPLSSEQAFILKVRPLENNQLELHFSIAPGYLLYYHHFQFRTLEGHEILEQPNFPPAHEIVDPSLGEKYKVYENQLILIIPNPVKKSKELGLRVQYQGCSKNGFCYTPVAKEIILLPNNFVKIVDITPGQFKEVSSVITFEPAIISELDRITHQLKTGAFPLTLLLFLGLGILLSFTPCVLPMIPIMANILVGTEVPLTSKRTTLLASLYILSVAICYAIAGTIAGLMGNHWQESLQKPIFLVVLSFILLLFSLNQFNLLPIQLPQIFAQTLHKLQRKQKQGSIIGAIAMGGISALMVSPCVTPALVGALTYIGQTGDALLGGTALFAMALGMGLPLLIVACVGAHLLPKAGYWMNYVKGITGLLLLILAISILTRAFPNPPIDKEINTLVHFISIENGSDLKKILHKANELHKPVILDVYADWCIACRQLDEELFNNKTVANALQDVQLLRLDISQQTKDNEALRQYLNIVGPPTLLFFSADGIELVNYRIAGKIKANSFIHHLSHFLKTQNK